MICESYSLYIVIIKHLKVLAVCRDYFLHITVETVLFGQSDFFLGVVCLVFGSCLLALIISLVIKWVHIYFERVFFSALSIKKWCFQLAHRANATSLNQLARDDKICFCWHNQWSLSRTEKPALCLPLSEIKNSVWQKLLRIFTHHCYRCQPHYVSCKILMGVAIIQWMSECKTRQREAKLPVWLDVTNMFCFVILAEPTVWNNSPFRCRVMQPKPVLAWSSWTFSISMHHITCVRMFREKTAVDKTCQQ